MSLIPFASEILSDEELKYAQFQLQRNQETLSYVQVQIDPKEFLRQMGFYLEDQVNFNNLVDATDDEGEKKSLVET